MSAGPTRVDAPGHHELRSTMSAEVPTFTGDGRGSYACGMNQRPSEPIRLVVFNRLRIEKPTANFVNTINTCDALARLGVEVIIYADLGETTSRRVMEAIGVVPSDNLALRHMRWGYRSLTAGLVARKILRRDRSRVNVALFSEVRAYTPKIMRAARRRGFLIAFEAHNAAGNVAREALSAGEAPSKKSIRRARRQEALERASLSLSDLVVVPQPRTLQAIRDLVRPDAPLVLLPNGTRVVPYVPAGGKEIEILYAGSLLTWKGVGTLIAAMARLAPYRLTILGGRAESERETLRRMARDLGCADRITFLPPVPPAEVWAYYARAKVGVVPLSSSFLEAREYTCPVKLMEMMGAGLPIVAARLPSVEEFVRDGVEVLLARCDDPEDFAAAIRRLLADPALAGRLAAAAHAKAEEHSYDRRALKLVETIRSAARARCGVTPGGERTA